MSRKKGSVAELRVAKMMEVASGLPSGSIRRTPSSGALIERADLRMSDEAQAVYPFFPEIKNREGWDFWTVEGDAWPPARWHHDAVAKRAVQLKFGTAVDGYPVMLVLLRKHCAPRVMFALDDLERLPEGQRTVLGLDPMLTVGTNYVVFDLETFLKDWCVYWVPVVRRGGG